MCQAEAAAAHEATPTLQQEHGHQAVLQIGSRRLSNFVMVRIPGEPSHVFAVSGASYATEIVIANPVKKLAKGWAYDAVSVGFSRAWPVSCSRRRRMHSPSRAPRDY
jgi:hypothetical protein